MGKTTPTKAQEMARQLFKERKVKAIAIHNKTGCSMAEAWKRV